MKRTTIFFRTFLISFVISGGAAFALYFGMRALLRRSPVIFAYPRGIEYYDLHPVPFLISLTFLFGLLSAFWFVFMQPRVKHFQWLQIGVIPFLTIVIAGPVWGLFAIYYDMKAGFFPPLSTMMNYLAWGAKQGFVIAPISALVSFPINIVSYIVVYLLLIAIKRSSFIQNNENAHENGG